MILDGLGFAALIAALFVAPYVLASVAFVVLFPICWVAGKSPEVQKDADAPCEYCGPGIRTGLPDNACENCMNTGLKYPALSAGQRNEG